MIFKHKATLLRPSDKVILLVSKLISTENDIAKIDALLPQINNWDAFAVQVVKRGVAGFFINKLDQFKNKKLIPNEIIFQIEQSYLQTINRSILLLGHYSNAANALQSHEIDVIALKGIYLTEHLYLKIGLRQFSDIDILIRPNNAQKAVEILKSLGYRYRKSVPVSDYIREKSDFVHLPPMSLNGVSIELHIKLHREVEKFKMNMDRVFASKISANINGNEGYALDTPHQIIHVALHAHKHFEEGNVNFTSFIDLANLLDTLPNDFYWKSFEKLCEAYKATDIVFRYILMVSEFFELESIPEIILKKYAGKIKTKHKRKFILYLQGYKYTEPSKTAIPGHLNNLQLLSDPKDIAKYLIDLFFPSKKFMVEKYDIKNQKLFLLYYPFRYLTIISGLWHIISKKLKTRA